VIRAGFAAAALLALAACSSAAKRPAPDVHQDTFPRVFHALRPSVVLFTMNIPSDDAKRKGQFDEAYGSGLIVASGPWGSQILTVEHVIHDARDLRATIGDRRKVKAHTIASDEKNDLALVATDASNLTVAQLGTSTGLEPGLAIGVAGYPIPDAFEDEGLGTATSVFFGRISSVRHDALELDVPIIPGESGGPVFDAETGAIVGLAESRFDEEKAIGFAIPIDDAKKFIAHAKGARVAQAH
jgi:S1-C subfamily serine protease